VAPRLARLAAAARGAAAAIEQRLGKWLAPAPVAGGAAVDGAALAALPAPLLPHALALLHRTAGIPYPPAAAAAAELARQLAAEGGAAVDCGDGWRWRTAGRRLRLERRPERSPGQEFSYILSIPGEVEIIELSTVVRLYRAPVARWMYRGAADRAALALPLDSGSRVTVRSRRPGDRLRPLGASGSRRLKEVLIDRRVPRLERDRLPLLCVDDDGVGDGGGLAWVPGVTVDERFRLPEAPAAGATVWVAELERR
jgi:tRNA(Ile)-lysidine synthase